jgi:hypothetical protein
VQATTRALYDSLEASESEATGIDDVEPIDVHVEIIALTKAQLPEKVGDVDFVLSQIAGRDASVYNLNGKKETQVLRQVWESGNENVRRQLINELVDCKKSADELYCPTGVVTRIVNATAIESPDKMARTTDVLRAEMMNTAARVRGELEKDKVYCALSDEAQSESLKKKLEETYADMYKGVLPEDVIQKELAGWIGVL